MKRILFVDDEPQVLDGLRDLLRRQRHEWRMVFALGGEEALRELEKGQFDVIVSDMRMPSIDGATLLGMVQERHPEVVRIVLSGQTEMKSALRAVPVAHQFLAKPCDRDQLRSAITRACRSQTLLDDDAVRRAAGASEALPSAPAHYTRLSEALADPETGVEDIAALVESDIAICAKVLQLVNSSFFGLGRPISSAREAVVYLGVAPLRALVLSAGAFQTFRPAKRIEGFSVEQVERHSTQVGRLAAKMLSDKRQAETAFTAGLLHDVGKLVIAARRSTELLDRLAIARTSKRPLHVIERQLDGVTHAEVGGYLLSLWGLPHPIVDAIVHHHAPKRLSLPAPDPATAVYVANLLIHEQEQRATGADAFEQLDDDELGRLGIADRIDGWRALAAANLNAGTSTPAP